MTLGRRSIFGGLLTLAAPAIIRTPGLLMPVKPPVRLAVGVPVEWIPASGGGAHLFIGLDAGTTYNFQVVATKAGDGTAPFTYQVKYRKI